MLPNTETKKYSMFSAGKIGKQKYNVVFLASKIPKQKNIRCIPASKYQNEKFFDVFLLQNTKTKKMIIYVVRMIDLIELNINFSTAFI